MKRVLLFLVAILLSLAFYLNRQSTTHQPTQDQITSSSSSPARAAPLQLPANLIHPDSSTKLPILHSQSAGGEPENIQHYPNQTLASLPSGEQESLWEALSLARREVRPIPKSHAERQENQGFDYYAVHQEQKLTSRFGPQGMQIVSSSRSYTEQDAMDPVTAWQANMRLHAFAGEEIPQSTSPEKSAQNSSKIEFHHQPGLIEWFDNAEEGLEHGYTIAARPSKLSEGEQVSLEVSLDGLQALDGRTGDGTPDLVFMDGETEVLSYSKLLVFDANGKELPATMKPSAAGFTLAYNDAQAVYPVIVDPVLVNLQANLNRLNAATGDKFGRSVALSGHYAIIGSPNDDAWGSNSGAAYIFKRRDTKWYQQEKLSADDSKGGAYFGYSVSMAGDSVVIGAWGDAHQGAYTGSAYVFTRNGHSWTQESKLTANDAAADDRFGYSVGISGNSLIVGAYLDDQAAVDSGAAYVFERGAGTWTQQSKLKANDAAANDLFGTSVAISGNTLIVGAHGNDGLAPKSGATYIFERNAEIWTQQSKLTAVDGETGDLFGHSVDIWGDYVIAGAPADSQGALDSGAAYVFKRANNSWTLQTKLKASITVAGANFGTRVAISGASLIVGADSDTHGGIKSGAAYLFTRSGNGWIQQSKITASDRAANDYFGSSVAISGFDVVVGAYGHSHRKSNSGSAYVFSRTGINWTQREMLTADDVQERSFFGTSVAIAGETVIVGASGDDLAGLFSGSAYIFIRSGNSWTQKDKLIASDVAASARFGCSVAISGDTVVVGALGDNHAGLNSGSAYVFIRNGSGWTQQAKLTANDAAKGDYFGQSLAISGNSIVVGASRSSNNSGSAYVFVRNGKSWTQQRSKLTNSDTTDNVYFGQSVAISGDTVVIGARGDNHASNHTGSVSVFVRTDNTWTRQSKLTASGASSNHFGWSVAISGDSVAVGAWGDDFGELRYAGSAHVFVRNGNSWIQQSEFTAIDAAAFDYFGWSVAISGNSIVIGAQNRKAYVFVRNGTSWLQQSDFVAVDDTGTDNFESVSISGDSVVAGASGKNHGNIEAGSVYIYNISHLNRRTLLVYDHLGVEVPNAGNALAFPGQLLGTNSSFTFRIGNAGELDLDIYTVALGGANQGQFGISVPDISSTSDLTTNETLDFTLSFSPTGTSSGLRNAVVTITSNDSNHSSFSFNISGLGISGTADSDGDGMTDWAEYSLGAFGFDWQTAQPGLVNDYYEHASAAGLYTPAQMGGVSGNMSLFNVDTANQTANLIIGLERSLDLTNFTPITLDPTKLSIDGDGNIRYHLDAPAGKSFFRAEWKGQ